MNILLLCDYKPNQAATVADHINSFHLYSSHKIFLLSGLIENQGDLPLAFSLSKKGEIITHNVNFKYFDVILVHYSLTLCLDSYVSQKTKREISQFPGLKAMFIQDEYRFVNQTVKVINDLGIKLVYTCVPHDQISKVYPRENLSDVKFVQTLTGYVPEVLKSIGEIPLRKRKFDVSYRGRKYPAWHGRQGLEKWQIAKKFLKDVRKYGLKTNISYREKDRIYGLKWVDLIQNSTAVLAVESGCSVFDMDGSISARSEIYSNLLKKGNKDTVEYEELRELFFKNLEDQISLEQISPRVFEAISLRTLLIAYEGNYSNILVPWKHYIPLKKDHSNMDEIVDFLRDRKKVATMISLAYTDIAMNYDYSYKKFIVEFDETVKDMAKGIAKPCDLEKFRKLWPFYFLNNPYVCDTYFNINLVKIAKKLLPNRITNFLKQLR